MQGVAFNHAVKRPRRLAMSACSNAMTDEQWRHRPSHGCGIASDRRTIREHQLRIDCERDGPPLVDQGDAMARHTSSLVTVYAMLAIDQAVRISFRQPVGANDGRVLVGVPRGGTNTTRCGCGRRCIFRIGRHQLSANDVRLNCFGGRPRRVKIWPLMSITAEMSDLQHGHTGDLHGERLLVSDAAWQDISSPRASLRSSRDGASSSRVESWESTSVC